MATVVYEDKLKKTSQKANQTAPQNKQTQNQAQKNRGPVITAQRSEAQDRNFRVTEKNVILEEPRPRRQEQGWQTSMIAWWN